MRPIVIAGWVEADPDREGMQSVTAQGRWRRRPTTMEVSSR
jgi:hypothetical protein